MTNNEMLIGRYRRFNNLKLGRLLADIAEDAKSLDAVDRAALEEAARRLASTSRAPRTSEAAVTANPELDCETGP